MRVGVRVGVGAEVAVKVGVGIQGSGEGWGWDWAQGAGWDQGAVPHHTRLRGGRVVLVTNSESVRPKSAVSTRSEPAAENAARNLPG